MFKSKALIIIGITVVAYLGIGFFLAPLLLKPKLERFFGERFGRELHIEHVRVNPLTLSVELLGSEVPQGGEDSWSVLSIRVPRVSARLTFRDFRPFIPELFLQQPVFTIKLLDGGASSLADWVRAGRASRMASGAVSPLPIDKLLFEEGQVFVTTENTGGGEQSLFLWRDVHLQSDIVGESEQLDFELAMTTTNGSPLQATGVFDFGELSSEPFSHGKFQVGQVNLDDVLAWAGYPQMADRDIPNGQIEGQYQLLLGENKIQLELADGQFQADHYSICPADTQCAWVQPIDMAFGAAIDWNQNGASLETASIRFAPFMLSAGGNRNPDEFQLAFREAGLELNSLGPTAQNPGTFSLHANPLAGGLIQAHGWLSPGEEKAETSLTLAAVDLSGVEWRQQTGSPVAPRRADNQQQVTGQLAAEAFLRFDTGAIDAQARFYLKGSPFQSEGEVQFKRTAASQGIAPVSTLFLSLDNPGAGLAKPFVSRHLGSRLTAETLNLELDYQLDNDGWNGRNSIKLAGTALLPAADKISANSLSPDWVMALLQAPDETIYLSPPAAVPTPQLLRGIPVAIENSVRGYLDQIVADPFGTLANLTDYSAQELGFINFSPGSAAIETEAGNRLSMLGAALQRRPRLDILVASVFDPVMDREALQVQQLRTHIALATAADLDFQAGNRPPDFADPVVHSVIDEFAARRLPASVLEEFRSHFGTANADEGIIPEGNPDAYYETLFEVLVEYAVVPESALTTLARYRSQAVIDTLAKQGIDRERLQTSSTAVVSESHFDGVPLPLRLEIQSAAPDQTK